MSLNLHFDHGVMTLLTFDPRSNQYEKRILRLPDPPSLESLEHLFSPAPRESDYTTGSLRHKCKSGNKTPRRCYSTPSLTRNKDVADQPSRVSSKMTDDAVNNGCHAGRWRHRHRRSSSSLSSATSSKRSLLLSLLRKLSHRQHSRQHWSEQTRYVQMRPSTEIPLQYRKEVGNWWAASPALSSPCFA